MILKSTLVLFQNSSHVLFHISNSTHTIKYVVLVLEKSPIYYSHTYLQKTFGHLSNPWIRIIKELTKTLYLVLTKPREIKEINSCTYLRVLSLLFTVCIIFV